MISWLWCRLVLRRALCWHLSLSAPRHTTTPTDRVFCVLSALSTLFSSLTLPPSSFCFLQAIASKICSPNRSLSRTKTVRAAEGVTLDTPPLPLPPYLAPLCTPPYYPPQSLTHPSGPPSTPSDNPRCWPQSGHGGQRREMETLHVAIQPCHRARRSGWHVAKDPGSPRHVRLRQIPLDCGGVPVP